MSRASPRFKRNNPPLPLVGAGNGVVLYRIVGSIEGQLTISTFFYSAAVNAPTQAQLTTLLTNISAAVEAAYVACVSVDWTLTLERLDVVHRNDLQGVVSTAHAAVVGGRAGGHLPTEVALPLLRSSATKGQHGRGRMSLPAISPSDVTQSKVTLAAEIAAVNALATAMKATATDGANTWTPCIAQRSPTSPKLVIGFAPITAVSSTFLLGTIRRRKLGRGK